MAASGQRFILDNIVQMCSGKIAVGAEWQVYVNTFRKVLVLCKRCKLSFKIAFMCQTKN